MRNDDAGREDAEGDVDDSFFFFFFLRNRTHCE